MLMLHNTIWILICIEKIYANVQTLFQRRSNTTRWKMYETLHGSDFLQCAAWCSQSDRFKSFSVEPAPLMCCLYSADSMDTHHSSSVPRGNPVYEKILKKSLKNGPVPRKEKQKKKLVSPLCVNEITNVALNKVTNESSFSNDIHESSQQAVDGNRHDTCINTAGQDNQTSKWWSVDLGAVYDVKHMRIWNSGKVKSVVYKVYVGNRSLTDPAVQYKHCMSHRGLFPESMVLLCKRWTSWQFVKIYITKSTIATLCEFEVCPRLCDTP